MDHNKYFSAYEGILEGYLQGREEHFLVQAFQLGRDMVEDGSSIELAVDIHFRALEKLKNSVFTRYPGVERRWVLPFLELTTPFGLACPNGSYGVTKLSERLGTAISGRNVAEEELRRTVEKHAAIIENSLTGIYIIQDGKLEFFNSRFAEIYGYSKQELLGMKPDNLLHTDEKERIREIRSKILTGQVPKTEYEARGVKKSGEIIWVQRRNTLIEHEGKPAILGNIVDITRTKQVEAQFRQAQKMETMGTLASGMAHDFNNFLSGILGYTELLLMDKTAPDPEYETYKKIEFLARKAGDLVRNILAFGRQTEGRPLPCNLNNEVKAVRKLLSSTVAKGIEIDLELEKDLHTINADPTQIHQILLNLCFNAGDAMPEGGRLSIKDRNVFFDESFCQGHPNLKPGNYVELSVSDTGCGIDRAAISRIFDPFFTTKPAARRRYLGPQQARRGNNL
ncbi:MAG: PAS domain S-box protein [Deltaproteobacteria bacterium]|nr:PAS domain S-box protein [Deltaproteobacteria bacterium]